MNGAQELADETPLGQIIAETIAKTIARAPECEFVFDLMLAFGLTLFEAAALERSDIDREMRWLHIVDGPRGRRIPIISLDQRIVVDRFLSTRSFHRIPTLRGRVSRIFHEFAPPGVTIRDVRALGRQRLTSLHDNEQPSAEASIVSDGSTRDVGAIFFAERAKRG